MELSWTTFSLEILNFLVLLWILKRFLYKPVLDVIARRRAEIDKQLKDAKALQDSAEKMQSQYESRLKDWQHERQQARDTLHSELEEERLRRLASLDKEIAQATQRAQVASARRQANDERKLEATALQYAARFATRLLEDASGPDTQQRLVKLLVANLAELPAESVAAIQRQFGEIANTATVTSAYPIDETARQQLEPALKKIISPATDIEYTQDDSLLAGLRIAVGAWELGINIQDELRGFAELAEHGSGGQGVAEHELTEHG